MVSQVHNPNKGMDPVGKSLIYQIQVLLSLYQWEIDILRSNCLIINALIPLTPHNKPARGIYAMGLKKREFRMTALSYEFHGSG